MPRCPAIRRDTPPGSIRASRRRRPRHLRGRRRWPGRVAIQSGTPAGRSDPDRTPPRRRRRPSLPARHLAPPGDRFTAGQDVIACGREVVCSAYLQALGRCPYGRGPSVVRCGACPSRACARRRAIGRGAGRPHGQPWRRGADLPLRRRASVGCLSPPRLLHGLHLPRVPVGACARADRPVLAVLAPGSLVSRTRPP